MIRAPDLPLFPGNSFQKNIGQTRFHKSHLFDKFDDVSYLSCKERPGIGGKPLYFSKSNRFPSIYAKGDVSELPPWIAYDQQTLAFDAYFQESIHEIQGYSHLVRRCKIYFFLADGTIKVVEPKVPNSGIPQGCLMARQRIRMPNSDTFYDIIDFNVGKQIELHGRVFKITNCDNFTRSFLNRLGIAVPDPVTMPPDPYTEIREKAKGEMQPKKPGTHVDKLGQFLEMDGKVLRFTASWDDSETPYGEVHKLEVLYYLADDTIEVKDLTHKDEHCLLYRRAKLPKNFKQIEGPSSDEPFTILNVLGTGIQDGRFLSDPLNCGRNIIDYYKDNDLSIGAVINVFGRTVVLTECDPFTQEYYKAKYGIDDFTPAPRPQTKEEKMTDLEANCKLPDLPPHNGFGTHEDSAINCRTVFPFAPTKSYKQFLEKDKDGYNSHILRFSAQLKTKRPMDRFRTFIISYYLSDDTMCVYETPELNSGYFGGMLISRRKIVKPGENLLGKDPPACYTQQDLYIGNTLCLEGFNMTITDADEYALRYMELHSCEFPKSNIRLILDKVHEALKPLYKDFVAHHFVDNRLPTIPFVNFRESLKSFMGENLTEHEILTLSRYYSADQHQDSLNNPLLQSVAQNELKRLLYNDYERLLETFMYIDKNKEGLIEKRTAYNILRGARLPLDVDLINTILDRMCLDGKGHLNYKDLINFLDYKKNPVSSIQPISITGNLNWISRQTPPVSTSVRCVNFEKFINDLDLEKDIIKQSS